MFFVFAADLPPEQPPALHKVHLPAAWEHCETTLSKLYNDNEEVSMSYQAFSGSVREAYMEGTLSGKDTVRIIRAIQFSAEKHKDQVRKNPNKSPYIIHPIGVANHLMNVGQVRDADVLISALLHDTVEDTDTTFEEIEKAFGATVTGYVRELTDDKSLPKAERKRLQIENASHKSLGAAMVKLSDKHYNLSDMARLGVLDEQGNPWSKERLDAYFVWAKAVVDALPEVNPALKKAVDDVIAAHIPK